MKTSTCWITIGAVIMGFNALSCDVLGPEPQWTNLFLLALSASFIIHGFNLPDRE